MFSKGLLWPIQIHAFPDLWEDEVCFLNIQHFAELLFHWRLATCIIAVTKLPLRPMKLVILFTVGMILRTWFIISHTIFLYLRTHRRNFSWVSRSRIAVIPLSKFFFFFFYISKPEAFIQLFPILSWLLGSLGADLTPHIKV